MRLVTLWGVLVLALMCGSGLALAEAPSPVGYWETIDDDGKTPTSIVHIYRDGDTLSGKIVKILKKGADPKALCEACSGDLKNKPVVGLRIVWGMKEDGDQWEGGQVLDPNSGKDYKCTMGVQGDTLKVRGFLGFSLLGRTQIWKRSTAPTT